MTTRIVTYTSQSCVDIPSTLPVDVYLCIPPALIAPTECTDPATETYQLNVIEGQLTDVSSSSVGCTLAYYIYTFEYDDEQLVSYDAGLMLASDPLEPADIEGFFIRNCTTDWVEAIVGSEVIITDDGMGNFTLTSQHGCTYDFTYTLALNVQDTNSIDMTLVTPDTIKADLIVDPAANNTIQVSASGVLVEEFTVADTSSVDLTVTSGPPQNLTAAVKISADDGNIVTVEPDGLYATNDGNAWCGVAGGTVNAIVLTHPNPPAALVPGMRVDFIASGHNTAATTLEITGIGGALTFRTPLGNQINRNDIRSGGVYSAIYNGTDYTLITSLPLYRDQNVSYDTGIDTESTGTPAVMSGMTTTLAVVAGDKVELEGTFGYSTSNVANTGQFQFYENAVGVNPIWDLTTQVTSSGGDEDLIHVKATFTTALTGIYTYDFRWARTTGAGIIYSATREIFANSLRPIK